MKPKRAQKVPGFYHDIALSIIFLYVFKFCQNISVFIPHHRPSHSALEAIHSQGKWGIVHRSSNTKPPSCPSRKWTITIKRKHSKNTDSRGYNNYFCLTNFELTPGLILAAGLMLPTPESKVWAKYPSKGLCNIATSSLRNRLCRQMKKQVRAAWAPITHDGEAAAVSSPGNRAASFFVHNFLGCNQQEWPETVARGWWCRGRMGRGPTGPKATSHVLSAQHTWPSLHAEVTTYQGCLPN